MTKGSRPSAIDQRVGLLAVGLALEGREDRHDAQSLVRAAGGNRMAVLRALGRLENGLRQPGPIGRRAAHALRLALSIISENRAQGAANDSRTVSPSCAAGTEDHAMRALKRFTPRTAAR